MKINFQITDKQALTIARRIISSGYGVVMYGWFDMKLEEIAEVIMISINSNTDKEAQTKLDTYYNYLLPKKERGE